MKCPSCGNYAKPEINTYFGFGMSMAKFKCQFCNDVLRANAVMLFFDFLSIAAIIAYVIFLRINNEVLFPLFGELTFPLLGFFGILLIRVPFLWLMLKLGRYVNAGQ